MRVILILVLLASSLIGSAQIKKQMTAGVLTEPLKIDAKLTESVYSSVQPAEDFTQVQPYNGKPSMQPTKVWIFYDQFAVYVGAQCYDSAPDSIFNLLTARDNFGMFDYFGVYLDPYNSGQLAYGFFLSPAGTQLDMKAIKSDGDNEDGLWDAVWESKTEINDKGWSLEMRIPYSALRFPVKDVQTWGVNFYRNIRRYNSNNSWNFVDRNVSGFIHQEGELLGIKNIKPPVRLSLSPYAAAYLEKSGSHASTEFVYKAGMDLKYGLSDSHTLDMMLVPDFGQIRSDDKQLNLSPYEIYYDEKRQFFNEGTELFQRAGIFYSRRIGAEPVFKDKAENDLHTNEVISKNPTATQMLNATKISGRTSNGVGVGVLNAMTLASFAEIRDTLNGSTRKVKTQPFTNYNVAVVDLSMKNNSYVSLINTNMSMQGSDFMANVVATDFELRNKSKMFAIKGKGGISYTGETDKVTGYAGYLELAKNKGKLQYGASQSFFDNKFDMNDMGYLKHNNLVQSNAYIRYNINEPFGIFRELDFYGNLTNKRLYMPNVESGHEGEAGVEALFLNNHGLGLYTGYGSDRNDYFETRVENRYLKENRFNWLNMIYHTDNRKKLNFFVRLGGYLQPPKNQKGYWLSTETNWRIGQKLRLSHELELNRDFNDFGFADKNSSGDSIVIAGRDVYSVSNILNADYAFSTKLGLTFRARHYWSASDNRKYYLLNGNGSLNPDFTTTENYNENYNILNIDLNFRWVFAPGSELSVAWKNEIFGSSSFPELSYFRNMQNLAGLSQVNSLSVKVLYYIDYNVLRQKI